MVKGYYYLVDGGYINGASFLTPYRGQRYHLSEFRDGNQPTSPEEFFNMKHSSARNVIERCFGLLKMRWAILRSPSFYDIKIQRRIISVCCMLHNFIRREMAYDLMDIIDDNDPPKELLNEIEYIDSIESSTEWTLWRQNLAQEMWNTW